MRLTRAQGGSLLGINGMAPEGVVNGVPIWRPMLGFDKNAIFAFAHRYGIPYFRDTTPTWSTRGKLRSQLLPLLARAFPRSARSSLPGRSRRLL